MSDELREFLQWWLKEAESDYPNEFVKSAGLCSNLRWYCDDKGECSLSMSNELEAFIPPVDACGYCFGDNFTYAEESTWQTMHRNPERLAFVRKMLAGA